MLRRLTGIFILSVMFVRFNQGCPVCTGSVLGEQAAQDAAGEGIQLSVVKFTQAKKGFVLLPRRWVVERSFAWAGRFRRLARDYEPNGRDTGWLSFDCLCHPHAQAVCRA